MNKFEKSEQEGRELFKIFANQLNLQIIHFTKQSDCYDVLFVSGGTEWLGEIKKRECNSNKYPDYILEKKKVDTIKLNFPSKKIMYINFFDDTTLLWDITNINQKVHTKYLPKTTSGKNTKIKKEYYLLSK